jgi:hypothetical protein
MPLVRLLVAMLTAVPMHGACVETLAPYKAAQLSWAEYPRLQDVAWVDSERVALTTNGKNVPAAMLYAGEFRTLTSINRIGEPEGNEALANLGVKLATSATIPLRIDHLPRGSYVVSAGSERRNATLADWKEISF